MLRSAMIVGPVTLLVVVGGVGALVYSLPVGPVVVALAVVPLVTLRLAGRRWSRAVPDLVFGAIDTGLLAIPAVAGGVGFGVAGAIAGGVIGDAITDAVAGFFEGNVAEWLRARGFEVAREPVTTALGKMAGCLLGSGFVLSLALAVGIPVQVG